MQNEYLLSSIIYSYSALKKERSVHICGILLTTHDADSLYVMYKRLTSTGWPVCRLKRKNVRVRGGPVLIMGQIVVKKNIDGIEGICLITPAVHSDSRGYFMETCSVRDMAEAGINIVFVQDNQSMSTKGVLRGLHFQKQFPQTKLVRVIRGSVFDVAVDLRSDSPTYGHWHGELLSEENKHQFLIPHGFAHGFLVLSDIAVFCYKCDDFYHPNDEGGMAWNDPEIGIVWPKLSGEYQGTASSEGYTIDGIPLNLSDKDQKWLGIKETFKF